MRKGDDEYMEWLKENHSDPVTDQAAHSHNCNDLVYQGNNDDLKEALFQRRYEEGYDIPDDEYMKWLRDNHPEDAVEYPVLFTGGNDYPSSLTDALPSIPMASPVVILNSESSMETGNDKTNDEATSNAVKCNDGLSLEGTNSVVSPVAILNSGSSMETGNDKTNDEATSNAVKCNDGLSLEGTNSVVSPVAILNLNSGSSMETGDDKTNDEATSNTAECDNIEGTKSIRAVSNSKAIEVGAKNTPSQDNKLRYISKYLVQFVPDAKPQTKGTTVRISGARVLTSESALL